MKKFSANCVSLLALLLLTGCLEIDSPGQSLDSKATWTVSVYSQDGTLLRDLKSYRKPSVYTTGRVVFWAADGARCEVMTLRGTIVSQADDPAS